ncbi:MAG: ParA family protein [Gammaproteobacteria bacterium]|nr:ParA family protein [Gammaproteobacteria bacterium]MDH5730068.1 ParA family protein [Gammaproteobacteria bacterium]
MATQTNLILNAKGGSGKSTLATNLASFYACWGYSVAIADFDPQASSNTWLKMRPETKPHVSQVYVDLQNPSLNVFQDYLILDVPSGLRGEALINMMARADRVLIPVLPSPMDIRACGYFIHEILKSEQYQKNPVAFAVVANRVKQHTLAYRSLEKFLGQLDIPFITTLRDTQNYIRAAALGLGIFDMPIYSVAEDLEQWEPILTWLNNGEGILPPKADSPAADLLSFV